MRLGFEETAGCFHQVSYFNWTFYRGGQYDDWPGQESFFFRDGWVWSGESERCVWKQPWKENADWMYWPGYLVTAESVEWEIPNTSGLPPSYRRRYSFVLGTGDHKHAGWFKRNIGSRTHDGDTYKLLPTRYRFYWSISLHYGDFENRTASDVEGEGYSVIFGCSDCHTSRSKVYVMNLTSDGKE